MMHPHFQDLMFHSDSNLIRELERRGYRVLEKGRARPAVSWNRVEPFPPGVDFKVEALLKIKEQIKEEHLDFETHPYSIYDAKKGMVPTTVHRAMLRVMR